MSYNISDSAYCRLCAKLKPYDLLTYMETGEEMCQKVVNILLRFNIRIDFQQNILPKTVCLPCIRSLEQAFLFITEIEQAQAILCDFMLVQINNAQSYSCDESMVNEPPDEPIHILDSTDQNSWDSAEVNDDGINLSGECDGEVMSNDSDDVYYDYSVINRNIEDNEDKKLEIQPTDDIIEIKDESDEEVTKDKLEKEPNNNSELRPFNIKVCSVEKINKQTVRKARIKIMDKIIEKLKLKHEQSNSEQSPPKLALFANKASSEIDINKIQKTDNNNQENNDTMDSENIKSNGNDMNKIQKTDNNNQENNDTMDSENIKSNGNYMNKIQKTDNNNQENNDTMDNENIKSNGNHIKLSWEDYEWKCTFCKIIFPHVEELQKHSMQIHNFCNPYQCSDCTSVRIKLRKFLNHIRAHRNDLQYSCYKCFKRFPTVHKTRIHNKRVHENSKYVCFGCNTPFNSFEELNEHSDKYYNKRYPNNGRLARVCATCGERFHFLCQLRYHMEVQHNVVNNSYHCDTCNTSFPYEKTLRRHQKSHAGNKPFTCDTCGKVFPYKSSLVPHMLTHTDTLSNCCTVCNKKFRMPAHLRLHMRMHTGEKPYSCEVCQRDFRSICNRNKHVRRCHGIELSHKKQPKKIHQTVPDETPPDLGSGNERVDEKELGE